MKNDILMPDPAELALRLKIVTAIFNGDIEALKQSMQAVDQPCAIFQYPLSAGPYGFFMNSVSPLHLAAAYGRCDMVQFMIEHYDADPNLLFSDRPPLHQAVEGRYSPQRQELIDYLVSHPEVNIHRTDKYGRNVLSYCIHPQGANITDDTHLLRNFLKLGVKPQTNDTTRSNKKYFNAKYAQYFPVAMDKALCTFNATAVKLLLAGGFDLRNGGVDALIAHQEVFNGRNSKNVIAWAETVRPYEILPPPLPDDLTGITRAQLEQKDENGWSLLDHPNTWFRFDEVQAALPQPFTLAELCAGKTHPDGASYLQNAIALCGLKDTQATLRKQSEAIGADDLVLKGKPTALLSSIVETGNLPELSRESFWKGQPASGFKDVYRVLDKADQERIHNYTQLVTALARGEAAQAGYSR